MHRIDEALRGCRLIAHAVASRPQPLDLETPVLVDVALAIAAEGAGRLRHELNPPLGRLSLRLLRLAPRTQSANPRPDHRQLIASRSGVWNRTGRILHHTPERRRGLQLQNHGLRAGRAGRDAQLGAGQRVGLSRHARRHQPVRARRHEIDVERAVLLVVVAA